MDIGPADALVLNALQYDARPTAEPFDAAAGALEIDVDLLVKDARRFEEAGVMRRFGVSFNSAAFGGVSALVLAEVPPDRAMEYARIISSRGRSKHSYVRSFPKYNLWFTYRAADVDALGKEVREMLSSLGIRDWVILGTSRVYKLSVKYDLERGTSWASPGLLRPNPPRLTELGIERRLAKRLEDLPISRRPFRELAMDLGETEEGLLDLVDELFSRGVAADFGAVLEPESVGIQHNAVVMGRGRERECETLAGRIPEATHVVLREPIDGSWDMRAYFVVHSKNRRDSESIVERAAEVSGIAEYNVAYGEGGFTV